MKLFIFLSVSMLISLYNSAAFSQWFSSEELANNPLPSKNYTLQEASTNPLSQKFVIRGNELFFIDEGFIFRSNLSGESVAYVKESSGVKSILLFKDVLIALQNDGDIFLLSENDEESIAWVDIGNYAKKIFVVNQYLIALVKKGEIWVLNQEPTEIINNFINSKECGINCIGESLILAMNAQPVAFQNSNIKDVKQIFYDENSAPVIQFLNGDSVLLNSIDFTN